MTSRPERWSPERRAIAAAARAIGADFYHAGSQFFRGWMVDVPPGRSRSGKRELASGQALIDVAADLLRLHEGGAVALPETHEVALRRITGDQRP